MVESLCATTMTVFFSINRSRPSWIFFSVIESSDEVA